MTSVFNDFAPSQVFKPQNTNNTQKADNQSMTVKDAIPTSSVASDSVEISNKKEKKGIIKSTKQFIANFKKFFATVGEYTKGLAKGIFTGAIAGSVTYTAGRLINYTRQAIANNAAKKSGEVVKVVKNIPSKLLAGIVAIGAVGANLWTASLNATEKQSEIDMRWTGVETKK